MRRQHPLAARARVERELIGLSADVQTALVPSVVLMKRIVPRSPLGIRRENVILCRYCRMASVPAFCVVPLRRKRVRCGIIAKIAVCPSVRVWEFVGIFFNCSNSFEGIGHHHEIRGNSVLFEGPLDFHNLGTFGKKLAVRR